MTITKSYDSCTAKLSMSFSKTGIRSKRREKVIFNYKKACLNGKYNSWDCSIQYIILLKDCICIVQSVFLQSYTHLMK